MKQNKLNHEDNKTTIAAPAEKLDRTSACIGAAGTHPKIVGELLIAGSLYLC
jgi:hypothetical protein